MHPRRYLPLVLLFDRRHVSSTLSSIPEISSSPALSNAPQLPLLATTLRDSLLALRFLLPIQQPVNRPHQLMPMRPQLIDPLPSHVLQHSLPSRQQRHNHIPPVIPAASPSHIPVRLEPVHEFHSAVMFQCEPVRQRPNRRRPALRQPSN